MNSTDYKDVIIEFIEFLTEFVPEDELQKSSVKRWAAYHKTKVKIDADVSEWAVNSYINKYAFLKDGIKRNQPNEEHKYEISVGDSTYRGDTMTSFSNFIRRYYIMKYHLKNISSKSCADRIIADDIPEEYIVKLADLTHTEGNFIPVPLCFNVERAGMYANCDYWDIVMYCIFRWCKTSDDAYISELLNRYGSNKHIAKSMSNFKNWMKNFNNNWFEFVNKNHLKAFVDLNSEEWYPKEFWEDHFALNRKLNKLSENEFQAATKLICDCIAERNDELSKC